MKTQVFTASFLKEATLLGQEGMGESKAPEIFIATEPNTEAKAQGHNDINAAT